MLEGSLFGLIVNLQGLSRVALLVCFFFLSVFLGEGVSWMLHSSCIFVFCLPSRTIKFLSPERVLGRESALGLFKASSYDRPGIKGSFIASSRRGCQAGLQHVIGKPDV